MFGLDLGSWSERLVARVRLCPPLLSHGVSPNEVPKVNGEVTSQQSLAAGDGEQRGEQLSVKLWFQDEEAAVDPGASEVGSVLGQVDLSEPLHHTVVRP